MKLLLTLAIAVCLTGMMAADDVSTAWRKVLKKCAKSDVIGSQALFFGVSNNVGPGSVWRFANDKSLRLMFELSDVFSPANQDSLVKFNNVAGCSGNSSSKWNLRLGLPFSTGVTPLSLDLGAQLEHARKVNLTITGWAIDDLKETNWKTAFAKLRKSDPDNAYVKELEESNRLLAENVVKVSGLKVVFTFGTKLTADARARFKGKDIKLGPDGASLHSDVTADNEVTVNATGPFYMIAAYSSIVAGKPVGIGPTQDVPVMLTPVKKITEGTLLGNDHKPLPAKR